MALNLPDLEKILNTYVTTTLSTSPKDFKKDFKRIVTIWLEVVTTFEFWLELAWLGAKCKGKTLLVIEMFFTFFNTALS